jgi:hypothetical protein
LQAGLLCSVIAANASSAASCKACVCVVEGCQDSRGFHDWEAKRNRTTGGLLCSVVTASASRAASCRTDN